MKKFRQERYITQRFSNGRYSFQVRIRTNDSDIVKTFAEKDYPNAKTAFETAVQFRDKTLYEIIQGTTMRSSNVTVGDMFQKFLETTPLSYQTKRKHKLLYDKYVTHKDVKMQKLTRADIVEDLNRMVDVASDWTISKVLTIWKNDIVLTALMDDIIYRDLTLGVKKPDSHLVTVSKTHEVDRETLDRVEKLIIGSVQEPYNARIINFLLEILYYTGMRPAEALALTKQDIHDGFIFITKELGSNQEEDHVIRRCKTKDSVRSIPIHPKLKPIIEDLLDYAERDQLFLKWDCHYMDSTWVGNIIRRLCKKEGIEFNMYRLRHNMATNLVTRNVDQKTTIELLGHSNYDMSLYYASSNDELKEDAITLFS